MATLTMPSNALSCPLCGAGDRRLVRSEPEGELHRCVRCNFLYVFPRPSEDDLRTLYDDEYFPQDDLATCLSFRKPVFRQCLNSLNYMAAQKGRLLDVGCGTGEFVAEALSAGWDAVGIESSRTAAQFASQNQHLPVHHAVLANASFDSRSFAVVTLLDVLEHLLNPVDEIARVYQLLQVGGIAVVRVPNTRFHLPKARICELLHISKSSLEMRYHLNHFTPRTLAHLLKDTGFEILLLDVGAAETKAHAAWASPKTKGLYVGAARVLKRVTGLNLGNIMVAYARKPA